MMWPSAMFNRQVKDATVLGVAMTVYGLVEVIFSLPFGKLSDNYGNSAVITCGTLFGVCSLLTSLRCSLAVLLLVSLPMSSRTTSFTSLQPSMLPPIVLSRLRCVLADSTHSV